MAAVKPQQLQPEINDSVNFTPPNEPQAASFEEFSRRFSEFSRSCSDEVREFLERGPNPTPEQIEQLAKFLDHYEDRGRISGSTILIGLGQQHDNRFREIAKRLYIMSSERLQKGVLDDDYEKRLYLVRWMLLKELSPRLVDDIFKLPHFEWPEQWPHEGWPHADEIDLLDRGNVGRLSRAVVELGDVESIGKFRSSVETTDGKTARVLLWAMGSSTDAESFNWLRSFIERTQNETLRNTAIVSLNRMAERILTPLDNPSDASTALSRKHMGESWRRELDAKGWSRVLTVWDL